MVDAKSAFSGGKPLRPHQLYRYRPLDDALLERELGALEKAYLWSPHFREMNDPMEAFYELGGGADPFIDLLLRGAEKSTSDVYTMARKVIDNFCLISLSVSQQALPMWAYYASNFAGMCLEFKTDELFVGDLQNELLMPVTYADSPLPAIQFHELSELQSSIGARLSRKRTEWRHEQEWRVLTGAGGPMHYVDDALSRIFLGPRVADAHADHLCALFRDRPTQILRGAVSGYQLSFETIKPAPPAGDCQRVGAGKLDLDELIYDRAELECFLAVPFGQLEELLRGIVARPNAEAVVGCDLSSNHQKSALYVWVTHRLRSGRDVWQRLYFDRHLKRLVGLN